jgi:Protein of unknown function (DUF3500)
MKLNRMILALVLTVCLASVAFVSQRPEPAAIKMAAAAEKFVNSLTAEQKQKAMYSFDSAERTNWDYVPLQDKDKRPTRKGLRLQDMKEEQQKLALALVAAGTSVTGNKQATTIMGLESLLKLLEAPKGAMVRDPEWYFFTVFGTPGDKGQWGWRVEGHHLSINYTLAGSDVVSATPTFFGANPATIKEGARKGERALPEAEDLARDLFKSLSDEQKAVALQKKAFAEPKSHSVVSGVGNAVGIAAGKLTEKQRDMLMKLVRSYANRLPEDVAEAELKSVQAAGTTNIHFAYTGATEDGKGYTYRVQGPSFVIEFLNVQADSAGNPANHIHSCWRKIDGDFGMGKK